MSVALASSNQSRTERFGSLSIEDSTMKRGVLLSSFNSIKGVQITWRKAPIVMAIDYGVMCSFRAAFPADVKLIKISDGDKPGRIWLTSDQFEGKFEVNTRIITFLSMSMDSSLQSFSIPIYIARKFQEPVASTAEETKIVAAFPIDDSALAAEKRTLLNQVVSREIPSSPEHENLLQTDLAYKAVYEAKSERVHSFDDGVLLFDRKKDRAATIAYCVERLCEEINIGGISVVNSYESSSESYNNVFSRTAPSYVKRVEVTDAFEEGAVLIRLFKDFSPANLQQTQEDIFKVDLAHKEDRHRANCNCGLPPNPEQVYTPMRVSKFSLFTDKLFHSASQFLSQTNRPLLSEDVDASSAPEIASSSGLNRSFSSILTGARNYVFGSQAEERQAGDDLV